MIRQTVHLLHRAAVVRRFRPIAMILPHRHPNIRNMQTKSKSSKQLHRTRTCLKKLNTSLSSDLAFIHSINATKCYATDYPTIKCVKQEELTGTASQHLRFMNSTLADIFFNRCTKYEFDESQPKKLQVFDLPFIVPGTGTSTSLANKKKERQERRIDDIGRIAYEVLAELMESRCNNVLRVPLTNVD
ncbi:hypothetical protein HA402_013790 [Bradysia odoriphaga]|nr:hypothetical protein HA402_013790 [Bradysia odoriphaga]